MIQRIQSVYLLIATGLLIWASIGTFFVLDNQVVLNGFFAGYSQAHKFFTTLPLNILLWLGAAISFITIFLFKNRILQMRLTTFTILLLLGFYVLLIYYRFSGINRYIHVTSSLLNYHAILPAISGILIFMAGRAIKKDEELVRSADRFRD